MSAMPDTPRRENMCVIVDVLRNDAAHRLAAERQRVTVPRMWRGRVTEGSISDTGG